MSDASAVAAPQEPQSLVAHPAVAQLSALHHFRTYVDIAIVVVVLALTNLSAHFTTPWASIAIVPAAAVGLLILVRSRGLGWSELGLGREHWKSGAGYALAAVAVVVHGHRDRRAAAVDAADVPEQPLRDGVRRADRVDDHHPAADGDPRGAGVPRRAARCAGPRLGLPGRRCRRLAAVRAVAHRHVAGADQQQCRLHPRSWAAACSARSSAWSRAVAATAVAGFVFTWLRRRSGSLIAPIALHWSLNGLGALAAALVWHLS